MADNVARDAIATHPIFIVGAPRSGTSWVQRLLLSDTRICGGQETHFFTVFSGILHSFEKHKRLGRNVGLPCYWDLPVLEDRIRDLWKLTIDPVVAGCPDAKYLIEKTPDHATVLPEILELLPESKIIHVVRDSRSVVASLLAASQDWGSGWAPKSARGASVLWYRYTRKALAMGKKLRPDQYLLVRYEDLQHDGVNQTRRLFEFLDVEKSDESLTDAFAKQKFEQQKDNESAIPVIRGSSAEPKGFFRKGTVNSWRTDLSLYQKMIVWRYTRKLMHDLGYNWQGRDFGQR